MIMKTRTQMLADAVRSGVRGLFGIQHHHYLIVMRQLIAAIESHPLELDETISLEAIDEAVKMLDEEDKEDEEDEEDKSDKSDKSTKTDDKSEIDKAPKSDYDELSSRIEGRSKAAEAAAEAAIMRESAKEVPPTYETSKEKEAPK